LMAEQAVSHSRSQVRAIREAAQAGKQVRDKAFRQARRARKKGSLASMHSRQAGRADQAGL
jgi:hypothetical protein